MIELAYIMPRYSPHLSFNTMVNTRVDKYKLLNDTFQYNLRKHFFLLISGIICLIQLSVLAQLMNLKHRDKILVTQSSQLSSTENRKVSTSWWWCLLAYTGCLSEAFQQCTGDCLGQWFHSQSTVV